MSRLEHAILALQQMQTTHCDTARSLPPVSAIVVTVAYLVAMLSVPVYHIGMLLWFALYPIVASPLAGSSFVSVLGRSLYALPFIALIGIFNPVFDTVPALTVGSVTLSRGWVTFASIILRGLMSVQAIVILINACGFVGLCRGLRSLGVPAFLVTQLLMVNRYMTVMLTELLTMKRARESRSYGKPKLPLRMWGQLTGQLFLRTVARAERINRAMLARGFNGTVPLYSSAAARQLSGSAVVFTVACLAVFAIMRFTDLSSFFGFSRIF